MLNAEKLQIKSYASPSEESARDQMLDLLSGHSIPSDQILSNLGLFLESKNLARLLFMDFLYRQVVSVQGVIMEFGVRWGQNLALFSALRGLYEPFNGIVKSSGLIRFPDFPPFMKKMANPA